MIAVLGLLGCSGSVLNGEQVVPGDVKADVFVLDVPQIGDDVVWVDGVFWVVSEAVGLVVSGQGQRLDLGYPGRGHFLWDDGGAVRIGVSGIGIFDDDGQQLHAMAEGRIFSGANGMWVAGSQGRIFASDGRQWELDDPRRVATDGQRIVALSCVLEICDVVELTDGGTRVLGVGDAAGGLGFWGDRVWWGLPSLDVDGSAGEVVSEDGLRVEGLPGDHLGREFGGGFTSGVTNWDLVPRRLRVVSLESDVVFAIDRHPGAGPVALNAAGSGLVIASPGWAGNGGAVFVVDP